MKRNQTASVTLGILVMLCLFGLIFGLKTVTAGFPKLEATPESKCDDRPINAGDKVRVGEVTVSVLNAGSASGGASKALTQLVERGFGQGSTGNAPKGTKVAKAEVWAEDPKNPAVRLVARQFGPGTKVVTDKGNQGPGVVVVVGDELSELNPNAPKVVRAGADTTICSPPLD